MKNIKLLSLSLNNFKGILNLKIDFGDRVTISGENGSGKTSINDAFCWVLFGKDSLDRQKFDIRPYKSSRDMETSVVAELSVMEDEKEQRCTLRRSNSEKWSKKRGTTEYELKGYTNSYEINDIPKTEGEYKTFIANIINEEEFKLLTNPGYFMSIDAKKRREMLIALCGDMSDEALLAECDGINIAREDILKYGLDDAKIKANKEYKTLTEMVKQYPARINEIQNMITDTVNVDTLVTQKNECEEKLKTVRKDISELELSSSGIELNRQINELTIRANELINTERKARMSEKARLQTDYLEKKSNYASTLNEEMRIENSLGIKLTSIENRKAEIKEFEEKAAQTASLSFDSEQGRCKACGQMLPASKVEELRASFDKNKEMQITEIGNKLTALNVSLKVLTVECNALEAQKNKATEATSKAKKLLDSAEMLYNNCNLEPDMNNNTTYVHIMNEIETIKAKISENGNSEEKLSTLREEANQLEYTISDLSRRIAQGESNNQNNDSLKSRLEALNAEYRSIGQEIATLECKIDEMEEYSRIRSKKLSEKCNSLFSVVHVEMFETQINGGIREICDLSYNGIRYSGSLNNGHKIVAGLDVIRAFQNARGVYAPIFLDNAECINGYNIPDMPSQMILLKVTEDKKIKIAKE